MTTLSDDLVYEYLKKDPEKYARALAAYENVRIDEFEEKCDSVESGSRMERALKGNTAGYESKIEVMVNDFTSRYGDSKSKDASQSRKKKNPTSSDGAKKAAPEKSRNPAESNKEKVDTDRQKSQIDPFGNASVGDGDQESGNDRLEILAFSATAIAEIRMRMNSELTGVAKAIARAAIK